LRKKGQAAEVDVAISGVEDTKVLMAFYEKILLKIKAGYLIRIV